jgi:S-DNA-T family DNA segregation ATPase FtsK/SpoIIIE
MKKFIIPQIVDDSPKNVEEQARKVEEQKHRPERFVSSVFGTNVKDEITYSGAQFGNKGRQYDVFRDKDKRVNKDDFRDYLTYNVDRDDYEKESQSRSPKRGPQDNSRKNVVNQDEHDYHESIVFENEKEEYPDKKIVKEFNKIEKLTQVYDDLEIEYEEDEPNVALDDYIEERQVQQARPVQRERKKPVEAPTQQNKTKQEYKAPPLSILRKGKPVTRNDMSAVLHQREQIDLTLAEFGISGRVVRYTKGPAVTQFEVQLDPGVRVQRVKNISSNIMADLKAKSLRIQAPIPGKSTVGIEVPNLETDLVLFGELLNNEEFLNDGNPMNAVLGLDLSGQPVYLNIAKMPHALIGGTTGSGKSVCINSIINSIIIRHIRTMYA